MRPPGFVHTVSGLRLLLVIAAVGTLPRAILAAPADPLEGLPVREVRVTGLRHLEPEFVLRQLATRPGQPFRRAGFALDRRRLDELRLFSDVSIEAERDGNAVVVHVSVTETLRLLPLIAVRVTDENGFSAGPGARGINLLGRGTQAGITMLFGGETGAGLSIDATTIAPGTWSRHLGVSYSDRHNAIYDFDEQATSADLRLARNFSRGFRVGASASILAIGTGTSGASLSADGSDIVPTVGLFVTRDTLDSSTDPRRGTWTEVEVDRVTGDADSWTYLLDGRGFLPLAERHGLSASVLATWQTGEVGVDLPEYLQFALGGGNTVRGWSLGSRKGRNQVIGTGEYVFVARKVAPFSVAGLHAYAGVQLAAFADVGAAWNDRREQAGSAIDGYGIGVRFLVPFVDLIRLDVAWGEPGHGATAYVGISLKAARQRQRVR